MKRSLLLREKLSLFSLCRGLDELQDDRVDLERLVSVGFIFRWSRRNSFEISLHECLPNSHCCLLEFWTDNIKDEFKDKICLNFFACWRHPLLWRENCRNSAFPVFNIRVQLPFLRWNYSQGTFATVLYEEKDILFFPALRTWKKKVCWIKNGEGKKIRIGCLKKKIQVGSTDLTRNGN